MSDNLPPCPVSASHLLAGFPVIQRSGVFLVTDTAPLSLSPSLSPSTSLCLSLSLHKSSSFPIRKEEPYIHWYNITKQFNGMNLINSIYWQIIACLAYNDTSNQNPDQLHKMYFQYWLIRIYDCKTFFQKTWKCHCCDQSPGGSFALTHISC